MNIQKYLLGKFKSDKLYVVIASALAALSLALSLLGLFFLGGALEPLGFCIGVISLVIAIKNYKKQLDTISLVTVIFALIVTALALIMCIMMIALLVIK